MKCQLCRKIWFDGERLQRIKSHYEQYHNIEWENNHLRRYLYAITRPSIKAVHFCLSHRMEFRTNKQYLKHNLKHHFNERSFSGGAIAVNRLGTSNAREAYRYVVDGQENEQPDLVLQRAEAQFINFLTRNYSTEQATVNIVVQLESNVQFSKYSQTGLVNGIPQFRFTNTRKTTFQNIEETVSILIHELRENFSVTEMVGSGWLLSKINSVTLKCGSVSGINDVVNRYVFGGKHRISSDSEEEEEEQQQQPIFKKQKFIDDEADEDGAAAGTSKADDEIVMSETEEDRNFIDDTEYYEAQNVYKNIDFNSYNIKPFNEYKNIIEVSSDDDSAVESDNESVLVDPDDVQFEEEDMVQEQALKNTVLKTKDMKKKVYKNAIVNDAKDGECVFRSIMDGYNYQQDNSADKTITEEEFKQKYETIYNELLPYKNKLTYVSENELKHIFDNINDTIGKNYHFYILIYKNDAYNCKVWHTVSAKQQKKKVISLVTNYYAYDSYDPLQEPIFLAFEEYKDMNVQEMFMLKDIDNLVCTEEKNGRYRYFAACRKCFAGFTRKDKRDAHVKKCGGKQWFEFPIKKSDIVTECNTYDNKLHNQREVFVTFYYDIETMTNHVTGEMTPISYCWSCVFMDGLGEQFKNFTIYRQTINSKKDLRSVLDFPQYIRNNLTYVDRKKLSDCAAMIDDDNNVASDNIMLLMLVQMYIVKNILHTLIKDVLKKNNNPSKSLPPVNKNCCICGFSLDRGNTDKNVLPYHDKIFLY